MIVKSCLSLVFYGLAALSFIAAFVCLLLGNLEGFVVFPVIGLALVGVNALIEDLFERLGCYDD